MARGDLLKKLFSSFKHDDRNGFINIANELIEDERKKNHGILAEELRMILFDGNTIYRKNLDTISKPSIPKDPDKDVSLVEVIYPDKYFNDLILPKEKLKVLESILRDFRNWDVLISNGVYPSRKILFYGPPGCGKTLSAHAIASELGIPMLYVRFDAVVSSFLGETASNIRKVFDYAKNDNWVIFFDEFDAIGRSRNDYSEHGEIKRVVNTFLQQLDSFKGRSLIITATNFEKSLDYALWRRFDETLNFEMPSSEEKLRLCELLMRHYKGPTHIFEQYLSQMDNFSHSDINKMCQTVMKECILDGRKMFTKSDIEQAVNKQAMLVAMRRTSY
ncbi:ATP-binding protein [Paenibacillus sp. DXFW5]|uniref:ATP-binding protein n=1 Tax=Paenibacillus rhizolycopersici TaxID=2780073 RepID=A0ABS2H5M3_9BACL|nr:AAA family ATPase [Paenibacillus rhizolycopersici]MBM6996091.1 ATP-binding protein [Paenibacillus rhizolycopersici]